MQALFTFWAAVAMFFLHACLSMTFWFTGFQEMTHNKKTVHSTLTKATQWIILKIWSWNTVSIR